MNKQEIRSMLKGMTVEETIAYYEKIWTKYRDKRYALARKCVDLENLILGTPDRVLFVGHTRFEILYGKLQKTATQQELFDDKNRLHRVKRLGRKPYNKYYAEMLEKTRAQLTKDTKKKASSRVSMIYAKRKLEREDENYPCEEIMGKPYAQLTPKEEQEYARIITRAREERRKMELGLPPYDRLKKS